MNEKQVKIHDLRRELDQMNDKMGQLDLQMLSLQNDHKQQKDKYQRLWTTLDMKKNQLLEFVQKESIAPLEDFMRDVDLL